MSSQYSLFDVQTLEEKRNLDVALGAPPDLLPATPPRAWRGPMRGMRFLKIGLADCFESGKEVEIRTCESYMPRSKNVSDIIPADEGEVVHRVEDNTVERWHEEGEQ